MNGNESQGRHQQQHQYEEMCCLGGGARNPFVNDAYHVTSNSVAHSEQQRTQILRNAEHYSTVQTHSSLPPPLDPTPDSVDALLAKELNQLSVQDREKIFEEIHGVDGVDKKEEDPSFLVECLKELNYEIQNIARKPAYLQAKFQNPSYVSKKSFLVRFLRSDSYNSKKAAIRLIQFFEVKLQLFGPSKLTKDIIIKDFEDNPKDFAALQSGLFQCLPGRDRAGRRLIGKFHRPEFGQIHLQSKLRAFWYLLMSATEDDIDQGRGIVWLIFNMHKIVNRIETWKNLSLLGALPVKINAIHVLHNDPKITALSSLGMLAMGSYYRARIRLHEGTIIECIYELMSFGIASRLLPIRTHDYSLDLSRHREWICKRKALEDSNPQKEAIPSKYSVITKPMEYDVLFGRANTCRNHPGTVRYRKMIDGSREAYESAKILHKTLIAERIVKDVKATSGRFLKQNGDGGWLEVGDETARDKISHAFRDYRRKLKKIQK